MKVESRSATGDRQYSPAEASTPTENFIYRESYDWSADFSLLDRQIAE